MATNYDLENTGAEVQERLNTVPDNTEAIEAEARAREEADTTLQGNIDAEATAREEADETLQGNIDALDESTYTKDEVDNLIQGVTEDEIIVVDNLPASGETNKVYRVPGSGYYTDYMWVDDAWKQISQYQMSFDQTQIGYFVCDTAAATAAKTVDATGYALATGGNMRIKMTNANTADAVTLNINNTGAKALFYNGEQASSTNSWEADEILTIYYDGTNFVSATSAETKRAVEELTEMVTYEYDGYMSEVIDAAGQRISANLAAPMSNPIKLVSLEFGINRLQALHTQYSSLDHIDMPLAVCSVSGNVATVVEIYTVSVPLDGVTSVVDISGMDISVPAGYVVCVSGTGYYLFGTNYVSQSDESLRSFVQPRENMPVGTEINRSDSYQCTLGVKLNYKEYVPVKNVVESMEDSIEDIENSIDEISSHLIINESGTYGNVDGDAGQRGMMGNYSTFEKNIKLTKVNLSLERLQTVHTNYPSLSSVSMPIGIASEDDGVVSLIGLYNVTIPLDGETSSVDISDMDIDVDTGNFLCFDATAYNLFGTPYTASEVSTTYKFGNSYSVGSTGTRDDSVQWQQGVQVEYVIQTAIDEYVEELAAGTADTLCDRSTATTIFMVGSSLSTAGGNISGFGWIDRLNDALDINIVNNAHGGHGLPDNLNDIAIDRGLMYDRNATAQTTKPSYFLCNNQANSTAPGISGHYQLEAAKEVADSLGARLLLGGEEGYIHTLADAKAFDLTFSSFAKENGIPYSPVKYQWIKCYPSVSSPYPGFENRSHGGYRTTAAYWTHLELLGTLPIYKNVKMFKVRPMYKNGTPTADQLLYDNNVQRLRYFTAISAGCYTEINSGHLDNLDQDGSTYDATGGVSSPLYGYSETSRMIRGAWTDITFDTFGLIEFILEKTKVSSVEIEFCASNEPTAIYVAVTQNSDAVVLQEATESVRSFWLEITDFTYNAITKKVEFSVERDKGDIQLYDKIRVLVEYSGGEFQMGDPVAKNYNGGDKTESQLSYHNRAHGVEINGNTSFDGSLGDGTTWSISGSGAELASFPDEIAMYPSYNESSMHMELSDNNSYVTKAITVPQGCSRVAVRVVAQSFIPVMTTRFSGTDIADSTYISESVLISSYEYDYDTLRLTVNDNYIEERTVLQGWMELYFEFDIHPGDSSLTLKLQRNSFVDTDSYPNQSSRMLLINDVSVQKIG